MPGFGGILLGKVDYHAKVTVGVSGNRCGFVSGSFGALDFSQFFRGKTLTIVYGGPSDFIDFQIGVSTAATPQNLFDGVQVLDGTGVVRTYYTNAAFFSSARFWSWGSGSNPVWVPANSGGVYTVGFF